MKNETFSLSRHVTKAKYGFAAFTGRGSGLYTVTAALALALLVHIPSASARDCSEQNGAEFICGVDNVEDFVRLPDGQVMGSDLAAAGKQGHFFLFNTDRTVRKIDPSEIGVSPDARYADCRDPPDWSKFTPHGMDIEVKDDKATLYVVNHGGREAVEIFSIDLSAGKPQIAWSGCLMPPDGAWPDDVAAIPSGGLFVSSLWDPRDDSRLEKLVKGAPIGELLEWHADKGWSSVPGTKKLSGPNGVIVSPDSQTIYLAAWSGKQLAVIDRATHQLTTIDLDYTPDNLSWSADGKTIFIGGATASVQEALDCYISTKANCPWTGVRVDRFHPDTSKLETLINGNKFGEFGMATGAIDVGNELWVNSYRSDRVAVFKFK